MLIQHHQGAIKMAQTAAPRLQYAEVKMKKSWAAPKKKEIQEQLRARQVQQPIIGLSAVPNHYG